MHLHIPIELDPPAFRPYRKVINAITAPAAIERMTRMIDFYCTWFVDQVIERGECDFTEIIGVPSIVTVDWLGLPVEDWARYASAHRATLANPRGSAEYHPRGRGRPPLPRRADADDDRGPQPGTARRRHQLPAGAVGRRPAAHRGRGLLDGRPARRRWHGHHVEPGQPGAHLALPAPGRAPAAHGRTPSSSTARSRSSCAASRRARRWPARSSRTSSSSAAR